MGDLPAPDAGKWYGRMRQGHHRCDYGRNGGTVPFPARRPSKFFWYICITYIYRGSNFSFDTLLVENGYLLCSPSRNYPSYVKMQLFERFYVTAESCPEGSVIVSKCAVQTLYHGYASRPDRWFLRCTAVQNRISPPPRKAQNGFYDTTNKWPSWWFDSSYRSF